MHKWQLAMSHSADDAGLALQFNSANRIDPIKVRCGDGATPLDARFGHGKHRAPA
jgi:hypothetical protein